MTFESHRNRISILKSGRRALESRSATTFATRWHREKGRIAAFEFFFFGCLELREFKYFESILMQHRKERGHVELSWLTSPHQMASATGQEGTRNHSRPRPWTTAQAVDHSWTGIWAPQHIVGRPRLITAKREGGAKRSAFSTRMVLL